MDAASSLSYLILAEQAVGDRISLELAERSKKRRMF